MSNRRKLHQKTSKPSKAPHAYEAKVCRPGKPVLQDLRVVQDLTVGQVLVALHRTREREREQLLTSIPEFLPVGYSDDQMLDPNQALRYLHDLRRALEAEAYKLAQEYSQARWKWYFRRIPRFLFSNHLSTTGPAHHLLCETLAAMSQRAEDSDRTVTNTFTTYPTSNAALRPVARMAELGQLLGYCHSAIRRAGKGTSFICHDQRLPERVEDKELERAITAYDQRMAQSRHSEWLQGIEQNPLKVDQDSIPFLTANPVAEAWQIVPGWTGTLFQSTVLVLGQFVVVPASLGGLQSILTESTHKMRPWWPDTLPCLVMLLQAIFLRAKTEESTLGISIPQFGYLTATHQWLHDAISARFSDLICLLRPLFSDSLPDSAEDVLLQVEKITPQTWPHEPGPVLIRVDGQIIVDLYSATQRLNHMLTMPRSLGDPSVATVSGWFELFVQEILDRSVWMPRKTLRAIRGRTLRSRSIPVTDIDAIGEHGRTLLIINCKNIPFTPAYNAGEWQAVRNIEHRLDGYVRQWNRITEKLAVQPVGDNYDLSDFDRILGAVITPHVLFSRDPVTNQTITPEGSLRAASSVGELMEFVNGAE